MPWNPWISVEADDTTHAAAKTLYRKTKNPLNGKISDLTRITSLTPEVAEAIHSLCAAVYKTSSGLTAREKEVLALVTSSFIGCVH
jgi:hypothetical protein